MFLVFSRIGAGINRSPLDGYNPSFFFFLGLCPGEVV